MGSPNGAATDLEFGSNGSNRYLWVANDGTTDRVVRYTLGTNGLSTAAQTSWILNRANSTSTWITLDHSNGSFDIWSVDSGTDRAYRYADGRNQASPTLTSSFVLAAGNTSPKGIADSPPAGFPGEILVPTTVGPANPFILPLPRSRGAASTSSTPASNLPRVIALAELPGDGFEWDDPFPRNLSGTNSITEVFVGPLAQLDTPFSLWNSEVGLSWLSAFEESI